MYLSLLWAREIPCPLSVPVSQVPPQWLCDLLEDKSNCCHIDPLFGVWDISTCLIAASLPLMYSTKSVRFVLEPNNRLYPGGPGGPGGPCGPCTSLSLMYCSMLCSTPWAGGEEQTWWGVVSTGTCNSFTCNCRSEKWLVLSCLHLGSKWCK